MLTDPLDITFHDLYWDFLATGGITKPCIEESWERHLRQTAYCPHNILKKSCEVCYKPLPPYMPGRS